MYVEDIIKDQLAEFIRDEIDESRIRDAVYNALAHTSWENKLNDALIDAITLKVDDVLEQAIADAVEGVIE